MPFSERISFLMPGLAICEDVQKLGCFGSRGVFQIYARANHLMGEGENKQRESTEARLHVVLRIGFASVETCTS